MDFDKKTLKNIKEDLKLNPQNYYRLGNIVLYDDNYQVIEGIYLSKSKEYYLVDIFDGENNKTVKLEDIKGAKINTKVLSNFGFEMEGTELGDDGNMEYGEYFSEWYFVMIFKTGRYVKEDELCLYIDRFGKESITVPIENVAYAHQLQNIYSALTSKELKWRKITPKKNMEMIDRLIELKNEIREIEKKLYKRKDFKKGDKVLVIYDDFNPSAFNESKYKKKSGIIIKDNTKTTCDPPYHYTVKVDGIERNQFNFNEIFLKKE